MVVRAGAARVRVSVADRREAVCANDAPLWAYFPDQSNRERGGPR